MDTPKEKFVIVYYKWWMNSGYFEEEVIEAVDRKAAEEYAAAKCHQNRSTFQRWDFQILHSPTPKEKPLYTPPRRYWRIRAILNSFHLAYALEAARYAMQKHACFECSREIDTAGTLLRRIGLLPGKSVGFFRNLLDVKRQADINRLVTRAARRCTRDFSHAIDHIPDSDTSKREYRERVNMWKETFWDCEAYRDGMHRAIWQLESKVEKLENQLRAAGIEPETDVSF